MNRAFELFKKHSLKIGFTAMLFAIYATLLEPGSFFQKSLFLFVVPFLGLVAFVNNEKMFLILQAVATIGILLSFTQATPLLSYSLLVGSSIIGIAYLVKTKYSEKDAFWPIGALGLIGLAFGLGTDAVADPLLFYSFLGFGSLLVALYSGIGFFGFKNKVAGLWLFLNIAFALNPLLNVWRAFL